MYTRTSFKWSIPVDFDPKHVVYVWINALTNYITGLGYDADGNHGELYKKFWPADLHLNWKDIVKIPYYLLANYVNGFRYSITKTSIWTILGYYKVKAKCLNQKEMLFTQMI
mgnify:CR=1 FL=1